MFSYEGSNLFLKKWSKSITKIGGCGAKFCYGYEPGAVVPALRLIVEILCFQERSFGPWYKFLVGGVAMLVSNVITVDQPLMLIVIV